jgi:ATPase subunit of ABC transporter with duplicated ATPase domains
VTTPIVLSGLSFAWPDGSPLFDGIDLVIGNGRTSVVGANGSGKSTLLRLVAGELTPAAGSVTVAGTVGYLPQDIALQADLKVEDVLGIGPARAALAAIEAGTISASWATTGMWRNGPSRP